MVLAALFLLLSLAEGIRSHAVRAVAILVVVALALFANHVVTYFGAIFIVATAVTEIGFLENLAAILRGSPEYFKWKMEQLSAEQVKDKLEREKKALSEESSSEKPAGDQAPPSAIETPVGNQPPPSPAEHSDEKVPPTPVVPPGRTAPLEIMRLQKLEGLALDRLELAYGQRITRNVQISLKDKTRFEADGVITRPGGAELDTIFEVQFMQPTMDRAKFTQRLWSRVYNARRYVEATGHSVRLHFVLVRMGLMNVPTNLMDKLTRNVDESSVSVGYTIFDADVLERDQP